MSDHKCCIGRGCGECSYCAGDCDYCNNLDCHGKECGTCYTCHTTDPRNYEECESENRLDEKQFWDVPAFQIPSNEQQLRSVCEKVGASFQGYEVSPAFRYVVFASREQMLLIAQFVPWVKYFHVSVIRNKECVFIETESSFYEDR